MIFSIPKSNSFREHPTYQQFNKIKRCNSTTKSHHSHRQTYISPDIKSYHPCFSQHQILSYSKCYDTPKKQLIYNTPRKYRSHDKYLLQNKKKVQKQIILKQLDPEEKRLYNDSPQNQKIYFGKKLVDPVNKKFAYCVQSKSKEKSPFVISEFLLEPCKINTKRLQIRPYTSQSFFPSQNPQTPTFSPMKSHQIRTQSSMSKKLEKPYLKMQVSNGSKNLIEFSKQLAKGQQKQKSFVVQPWDIQPLSHNMQSIKIH